MPQLVTNSRGDVRDVARDAQKAFDGFGGGWASLLGMGGTVGRNQDLAATRQGAAAAYQLVPPINRAVNLRSNAINALTWKLMDTSGNEVDNSENAVPQSDFGRMMKRAHQHSRIPLLGQISYAYDLYGECYIEPLGNGYRYNGVKWLNPLGMWVEVRNGEIIGYRWTPVGDGGAGHSFEADEIAYDHTFNPFDDFRGQGLVEVAMDTINIDRNLQRYMQAFFRNNAMPNVLVSPKEGSTWNETNRNVIKSQVENFARGSDNAFSTLVAPMPADWTTFDPPDIQNYYSIDEPLTRKILMIFGVPLAMAGDETGARYKTGKDVLDAFYLNTIIPLATSVRDYVNNQLLPFFDDTGLTFQFDTTAYDQISDDDVKRSQVAVANYAGGLWSQQEARTYTKQDEQLDPLDTLYVNVQPPPNPAYGQPGGNTLPTPVANSEPGSGEFVIERKAFNATDSSALLCLWLANDPQLVAFQEKLKEALPEPGIEWQDPATFHMTLIYADNVPDAPLVTIAEGIDSNPVRVTGSMLGVFDNGEEHALHLKVELNATLGALQKRLYAAFAQSRLAMSPYSDPAKYQPHITLAYLPAGMSVPAITPPVDTMSDKVLVSRADYEPFAMVDLARKSAPVRFAHVEQQSKPGTSGKDELRAWRKVALKGNALKAFTAYKLDKHIEDWVRAELEGVGAKADKALISSVFNSALYAIGDRAALKAYASTSAAFKSEVEALISAANADETGRRAFAGQMRSALRRYGLMAFRDGMERGKYSPESFDAEEVAQFRAWLDTQSAYVTDLGAELFKEGQTPDPENRATLWINKSLDDVYFLGLSIGAPLMKATWRLGKTEKHCATCSGNNGQTKTVAEWKRDGLPRSSDLDCGGWRCDCAILDDDGEAIGAI